MGQQAHAQSHADHGHAIDQVAVKDEDGAADAWAAIAIITIIIVTALFWLTGHAS